MPRGLNLPPIRRGLPKAPDPTPRTRNRRVPAARSNLYTRLLRFSACSADEDRMTRTGGVTMDTARIRKLRLKPLAGCLATALAFATAQADAKRIAHEMPPQFTEILERVNAHDLPPLPDGWHRPSPADIMLRTQPTRHEIPPVPAGSIVVQNCNDSGAGSLRQALADAGEGGTIDLSQLSCSTISLTTGSLVVGQQSLHLQGPGSKYLSITGNDTVAPILHDGLGTLYVSDLAIEHGAKYFTDAQIDDARGGCIFSGGSVFVTDSVIAYCEVRNTSTSHRAIGGAIYAYDSVSISNSSVLNSSAVSGTDGAGGAIFSPNSVTVSDSVIAGSYARDHGGGVYAFDLTVKYSTISANQTYGIGGGLYSIGNATITNSTIDGNSASLGGGLVMNALNATHTATLLSSTVSGNISYRVGGAWVGDYADVHVANSTIVSNAETSPTKYAGGLFVYGTVDVQSTIVGNNTYAGGNEPDDVGGNQTATITGANNLFVFSSVTPPGDTIELVTPELGPLEYNGGSTRTHRLMSTSAAIDAGNDAASVAFDQRGSGYPRVLGDAPDIGAYELDASDIIFDNGFDP
jgi:hypothetical protein